MIGKKTATITAAALWIVVQSAACRPPGEDSAAEPDPGPDDLPPPEPAEIDVGIVGAGSGPFGEQRHLSGSSGCKVSFGVVCIDTMNEMKFFIANRGGETLFLTGVPDPVAVSGVDASMFAVTSQPPASLHPGGSAFFAVACTSKGIGEWTATLTIANNDEDEDPYDLTIEAVSIAAPAELPQTGQTTCYGYEDDGYLRKESVGLLRDSSTTETEPSQTTSPASCGKRLPIPETTLSREADSGRMRSNTRIISLSVAIRTGGCPTSMRWQAC